MLETFRAAPPQRQLIVVGLVGALFCVLLAAAYFLWFRTGYEVLFRDLREADAATIVAELDRTHADYRLADGGRTILVPAGAADTTRLHVAGQNLPLQGTVGFELFNNSSIGLTEFAQRINLQRALQGELGRTIMNLDGVESARVHLSLGEQSIFRGERRPPRASVAIRMLAGRQLNATAVRGVQRLVSGSVPELDPANVAILNDRGVLISAEPAAEPAAGGTEARSVERFFEARVRRAIEARFPPDAVEVNIWAALREGAATPSEEALASGRDFRLRATVAVATALSENAREEVTQAVRAAIGYDGALGDTVSVTASPRLPAVADWSATETGATAAPILPAAPRAEGGGWLDPLWTPLLLLILAGAALFVVRRRRAPAPMSEQDRLAYAANLKTLLAQRDPDVATAP